MTGSFAEIVEGRDGWLTTLSPYQRTLFDQLEQAQGSLEGAVQAWLDLSAASNLAIVGAGDSRRLYFDAFKDALYEKLCAEAGREEREELVKSAGLGHAAVVGALTASISPALSAAPAFVAPAVAVMLHLIASTGLTAWCRVQADRRGEATPPDGSP